MALGGPAQTEPGVRPDLRMYASAARRDEMLNVCDGLASFDRPTLAVWTPEDRVQRPKHGQRPGWTAPRRAAR